MHPRLLEYYNRELAHLREMGAEFAQEFPKVAARLGMEGIEVADPYVERLMEGFAFIAARIQLKIDAEFPRFTQHLLEMIYPHYLAPTPSFAMVAFQPNFADGALAAGVEVPRGSTLRSVIPRGQQTACEFRTAHAVRLFPIELLRAEYSVHAPDLPLGQVRTHAPVRAGLRLRLKCHAGLNFRQLDCGSLVFHINAPDDLAIPLYELIFSQCLGAMVVEAGPAGKLLGFIEPSSVMERGFGDEDALIHYSNRSFQGYRLLHEYFAFPQRFLFFEIKDLGACLHQASANEMELVLLFGRNEARLEGALDPASLCLYATPVVNLFARRADRLPVHDGEFEHHLVVDRTRPLDYEVHSVKRLRGFGIEESGEIEFLPFYAGFNADPAPQNAYYTLRREPRLNSVRQQQTGGRSAYAGSEVFIALTDPRATAYPANVKQLGAEVWATNRDLPLLLPVASMNPLSLEGGAPVARTTVLRGPTRPRAGVPEGEYAWRLIDHLALNYLTLLDKQKEGGASAFKELLELYADPADPGIRKQIDCLQSITSRPVVRRLPLPGPIAFGRGIAIDVQVDESGLAGAGGFLLGSLLEKFFARYVSINSFTQTRLLSHSRSEVHQWPARIGSKTIA